MTRFSMFSSISIDETDWSFQMAEEIFATDFECPGCQQTFNFTNLNKLQHTAVCKPAKPEEAKEEELRPTSSNQKRFECLLCHKTMYMTNIDILKHKKKCKVKEEKQ